METRDVNFNNFKNDPDWLEVKRLSELNGPIVEKIESSFLKLVPYSPVN